MIEQDTIKLLRECDAGVKMGVSAIDEVMDYVKDNDLRKILQHSLRQCWIIPTTGFWKLMKTKRS